MSDKINFPGLSAIAAYIDDLRRQIDDFEDEKADYESRLKKWNDIHIASVCDAGAVVEDLNKQLREERQKNETYTDRCLNLEAKWLQSDQENTDMKTVYEKQYEQFKWQYELSQTQCAAALRKIKILEKQLHEARQNVTIAEDRGLDIEAKWHKLNQENLENKCGLKIKSKRIEELEKQIKDLLDIKDVLNENWAAALEGNFAYAKKAIAKDIHIEELEKRIQELEESVQWLGKRGDQMEEEKDLLRNLMLNDGDKIKSLKAKIQKIIATQATEAKQAHDTATKNLKWEQVLAGLRNDRKARRTCLCGLTWYREDAYIYLETHYESVNQPGSLILYDGDGDCLYNLVPIDMWAADWEFID